LPPTWYIAFLVTAAKQCTSAKLVGILAHVVESMLEFLFALAYEDSRFGFLAIWKEGGKDGGCVSGIFAIGRGKRRFESFLAIKKVS